MITDDMVVRRVSTGEEVCDACEKKVPKGIPYLSATFQIKVGVWPLKKTMGATIFLCVPCASKMHTIMGERLLEK